MTARYRATLAYDGGAYQGFQRQTPAKPSIQAAVERAIGQVTGQAATVHGAGRTDTGVHAEGQVIAFDVEWRHSDEALLRALNANLPDDIALQDIRQHEGFSPRFDAVARIYRYTILQAVQRQPLLRQRVWQVYGTLDDAGMAEAASLLLGTHDFAAFGQPPQGTNTVRVVYRSEWNMRLLPQGSLCAYHIEANAFLKHMVRRIVGMLVEVGRGSISLAEFRQIMHSGVLAGGVTLAPPQGLVLESVRYPSDKDLLSRRGIRPSEDTDNE
jgi:tRNA pseudouridine38-40 synthase